MLCGSRYSFSRFVAVFGVVMNVVLFANSVDILLVSCVYECFV